MTCRAAPRRPRAQCVSAVAPWCVALCGIPSRVSPSLLQGVSFRLFSLFSWLSVAALHPLWGVPKRVRSGPRLESQSATQSSPYHGAHRSPGAHSLPGAERRRSSLCHRPRSTGQAIFFLFLHEAKGKAKGHQPRLHVRAGKKIAIKSQKRRDKSIQQNFIGMKSTPVRPLATTTHDEPASVTYMRT